MTHDGSRQIKLLTFHINDIKRRYLKDIFPCFGYKLYIYSKVSAIKNQVNNCEKNNLET